MRKRLKLMKEQRIAKAQRKEEHEQQQQSVLRAKLTPEEQERRVGLNNEITGYARRKELSRAEAVFKTLQEEKLANNYSYANMMNARVRCGDSSGAVALLGDPFAR